MITNTANKVIYTGNGTNKEFDVPFEFNAISELALLLHVSGENQDTPITANWSYDENTGKITYPVSGAAIPSSQQLIVLRQTPQTQLKDHDVRLFTSEDIEDMADKLTREMQDVQEQVNRALKYPASYTGEADSGYYLDTLEDLVEQGTSQAGIATQQAGIATTKASEATASASAAATSAQNAATSETAAANSASAAAASEQHTIQNEELLQEYVDEAEASATASAGSANASAASATQAATSATNAASSASDASDYADDANDYATQAQTYAGNASTQATNAANSATSAASSATTASSHSSTAQSAASTATEKANAASTSATAAAGSATSAGTSADNAAASALAASTSATAAQNALAEVQNYRRIDRTYIAGTAIDDYSGSLTVFDLGLDFDLTDYVVDVLVNGKGYQGVKAPVDFTVSGDVVTFVEAVPVGAVVQFRINASTTVIIAGSVDVDAKITDHNTSSTAHSDIRTTITTHTGNANIHVTSSDKSNWNAKQAALSTDQIAATNSGVTAAKVSNYDTHVADTDVHVTVSDKSNWNGKQSALSTAQLSATNSGVTSTKVSGYDTHVANGDIHVTAAQKTDWTGKQDAISDLATIRSGAAAGATAVQPAALSTKQDTLVSGTNIKTVNGTSLLGSGNINIDALPSQTGQSGKFLSTNGTTASWEAIASGMPLFYHAFADHLFSDTSWLRADTFSWQDGSVYTSAYQHLVDDYNNCTKLHKWVNNGVCYWTTSTSPSVGDDVYGGSPRAVVGTVQAVGNNTITYNNTVYTLDATYTYGFQEQIAGTTITFYRSTDGHKIVLADQESNVSAIYTATGVAWYYILDTANTRFKLPRTKYNVVGLRDNVGNYVEESLPNITGTVNWAHAFIRSATGVYRKGANTTEYYGSVAESNPNNLSFDASRSSSTYQNNAPVQQRATQMYLYFYCGNTVQSQTTIDVGEITEALNGKADTDLANITNAGKQAIINSLMPDYKNVVSVAGVAAGTYTKVVKDSFVITWGSDHYVEDYYAYVSPDNGTTKYEVGRRYDDTNGQTEAVSFSFFVPKGWSFTNKAELGYSAKIYPLKGAQ